MVCCRRAWSCAAERRTLPGIRDLAREVMGLPTRIGEPQNLRGLVETLHSPAYAASIGLLEWGIQHDLPAQPAPQPPKNGMKMPTWLKAFCRAKPAIVRSNRFRYYFVRWLKPLRQARDLFRSGDDYLIKASAT
ncbi:MAG: hypothetical protein H6631_15265 [Anaerolineaceae bacterium]|nr:hypothetical protein [Anaerolineaceae bacterium]